MSGPWLAGMTGLLVAGVAGVLIVAASLPGHGVPGGIDFARVALLAPAFSTVAAVLLPAIALGIGRRMATTSPAHVILGAGLVILVFVLPSGPLLGNYWMATGVVGDIPLLYGTRDPVIGAFAWAVSQQLALLAAILLAALAFRWGHGNLAGVRTLRAAGERALRIARSPEAPLLLFLAGYAVELALFALVGSLYDRYLYPLVPVTAILLLEGRPRQPASVGAWSSPAGPPRGSPSRPSSSPPTRSPTMPPAGTPARRPWPSAMTL